jgi:hypothetical protein
VAAVYVNSRLVVENPGYIPEVCDRVDLPEGEHTVKLRYA